MERDKQPPGSSKVDKSLSAAKSTANASIRHPGGVNHSNDKRSIDASSHGTTKNKILRMRGRAHGERSQDRRDNSLNNEKMGSGLGAFSPGPSDMVSNASVRTGAEFRNRKNMLQSRGTVRSRVTAAEQMLPPGHPELQRAMNNYSGAVPGEVSSPMAKLLAGTATLPGGGVQQPSVGPNDSLRSKLKQQEKLKEMSAADQDKYRLQAEDDQGAIQQVSHSDVMFVGFRRIRRLNQLG